MKLWHGATLAGILALLVGGAVLAGEPKSGPCCDGCIQPCDVMSRMNMTVTIDFHNTPLSQVLDHLKMMTGLPVDFDCPINLDQSVTMKLEDVPLKSAISVLLDHCHLACRVDCHGIHVAHDGVCEPMAKCGCSEDCGACSSKCEKSVCSGGKCCCATDTPCAAGCTPDNCCCKSAVSCGGAGCAKACSVKGCACAGASKPWAACIGSCVGAMVGTAVDHPGVGAMVGSCVGSWSSHAMSDSCGKEKACAAVESRPGPWFTAMPMPPMPPVPPMPPCGMPCAYVVPPPAGASWTLSKGADGIHISGPGIDGCCEHVHFGGPDGCVVLEGKVRLKCHKDGHHAEVSADHVCVRLADMAIQISGRAPGAVVPASCEEGWRPWMGFFQP